MNARATESSNWVQGSRRYSAQNFTSFMKKIVTLAAAQDAENMRIAMTCNAFAVDVIVGVRSLLAQDSNNCSTQKTDFTQSEGLTQSLIRKISISSGAA